MPELSEVQYAALRGFVRGFCGSRCAVRSQHKLPCLQELEETLSFQHLQLCGVTKQHLHDYIQMLIDQGLMFMYGTDLRKGAYISDHPIDVL